MKYKVALAVDVKLFTTLTIDCENANQATQLVEYQLDNNVLKFDDLQWETVQPVWSSSIEVGTVTKAVKNIKNKVDKKRKV